MNNFNYKIVNDKYYYFVIIVFSLLISLYYGYRGVFPLDSFIIFDAGYKIQNKFYPFADYWSITGPFLDYIQFFFFKIFGLSWFSYVLHAAVINCLLSVISFFFFTNFGLEKKVSIFSSVCISILAYPSAGTPFMDHHAVIFSLISMMFLILGLINQKKIYWILSSVFLLFSFFSKQIPSAYLGILFTLIAVIFYFKIKKNNNFFYFIYGILITSSLFLLTFSLQGSKLNDILIQYVLYPQSIGSSRIENFQFDLNNIFFQFKFLYFSITPLLISLVIILFNKKKENGNISHILILSFLLLSFCIFIYTQMITKNQILIFFLIPFFLTLSIFYTNKLFCKKKLFFYLIIFVMILTTGKYHLRFNENKKFMELVNADFKKAINAEILDKKLKGLKWISPNYIENPIYELNMLIQVKNILIQDKTNKIIMSDYQILPAITQTKLFAPNKWFDPLSVPNITNKYFNSYKKFFLKKLKEKEIQTVYVVGKKKLDYFIRVIDDKNCFSLETINEISLKVNIIDCY